MNQIDPYERIEVNDMCSIDVFWRNYWASFLRVNEPAGIIFILSEQFQILYLHQFFWNTL